MIFYKNVSQKDRSRIKEALESIKNYGDNFQFKTASFLENTNLKMYVGPASEVRGSGSVKLDEAWSARRAVKKGELSIAEAAQFVRLSVARETIDLGGQQGIEGTLVHEGKHALDFALMLATFSKGIKENVFDPTAFQREYSAHLTSAFYLMRRGGSFTKEGISLGLLYKNNGSISINRKGIRSRLKNNYNLSKENPGIRLSEISFPKIKLPRKKWFGIF